MTTWWPFSYSCTCYLQNVKQSQHTPLFQSAVASVHIIPSGSANSSLMLHTSLMMTYLLDHLLHCIAVSVWCVAGTHFCFDILTMLTTGIASHTKVSPSARFLDFSSYEHILKVNRMKRKVLHTHIPLSCLPYNFRCVSTCPTSHLIASAVNRWDISELSMVTFLLCKIEIIWSSVVHISFDKWMIMRKWM